MDRLNGKVAVVTGAASGMGRATAELFAIEGADTVLTDLNEQSGKQAAEAIRAAGGNAAFYPMDVTDESSVAEVYSRVGAEHGTIDVLVNCAGIIGVDKPTHELTEADWDALFAVDVKGVFFSTKHAVPYMIAQRSGSIVNYSSIYGVIGNEEFSAYHVAKGAVNMQTRQDAAVYGRYNIRVNSVNPSTVLTPLVRAIADEFPGGLTEYEKVNTANQSIRRLGQPIDVAHACLFLASDESAWITGVNLPVDGGFLAR
ncbi:SDR family NAD(P)-dependent oxidoreductase [Micromonospora sp. WMMD558]|uniref:SDR family NAD(P)-dependent oxidoreductase n=1 Tax=Micromonospora sp. WMMD558 TaxID=3403462 RepID=UPI003BF53E95